MNASVSGGLTPKTAGPIPKSDVCKNLFVSLSASSNPLVPPAAKSPINNVTKAVDAANSVNLSVQNQGYFSVNENTKVSDSSSSCEPLVTLASKLNNQKIVHQDKLQLLVEDLNLSGVSSDQDEENIFEQIDLTELTNIELNFKISEEKEKEKKEAKIAEEKRLLAEREKKIK